MASPKTAAKNTAEFAILSTYVPRHCGIATFSHDLLKSYQEASDDVASHSPIVIAISDELGEFDYPPEVAFEIRKHSLSDYRTAAEYINQSPAEIVDIQHEYGIFGGQDGEMLLHFIEHLKKPFIITLHTVLPEPSENQRRVLSELCDKAFKVIVLAKAAIPILETVYSVSPEKTEHISHGAPDLPFTDPAFFQETLGLTGRWVLMTFGHLGPSKGIEMALEALSILVKDIPNVTYLIVGATHPELIKHQGEQYRENLEKMVADLGLQENVVFVNRYLSDSELKQYIQGADIYISPYPGAAQISSGPLTYAVAAGKAVIATPYLAAQEMLAEERGILTPFQDPNALAKNLYEIIKDDLRRVRLRKSAYRYGRTFTWQNVGKAHYELVKRLLSEGRGSVRSFYVKNLAPVHPSWDYLLSITDSTGVLQHAKYTVPDREHGYCTDDNARALIVACKEWQMHGSQLAKPMITKCLSFLRHAYNPTNQRSRNFMGYDRKWMESAGSEDSHARALWAVGYSSAYAMKGAGQRTSFELFHLLLPKLTSFTSPRAWAFGILGIDAYLSKFQGDLPVRRIGTELVNRLLECYQNCHKDNWNWFEDIIAYDNARLPEALIAASSWVGNQKALEVGISTLTWLFENCLDEKDGHLSFIGNRNWWKRGKPKSKFDQQPVDACAMLAAAKRAYETTRDSIWKDYAERAYEWFFGRNDLGIPLVDETSGGCRDGLCANGVNENMGAESTLSFLLAALDYSAMYVEDEDTSHQETAKISATSVAK